MPESTVTTHTIQVTEVPDDLLRRLNERARALGRDRSRVIVEILAEGLESNPSPDHKTFDDVLAPIRRGFAESGMTEEEANELLENELRAVRAERRIRRAANG